MKRRVPATALLLSVGVGVGLGVAALVLGVLRARGQAPFFERGDARMFWLTTRDLFGAGHGFAALGRASEIPYRYGRVGLPFVAWILAFGHLGWVGITLIGVNERGRRAASGRVALIGECAGPA